MAQTIKHRRGKLESIKDITPINGELIIASGSDLSVHQEGLLFVGVEGNVLTPSNKILTGSATAPTVTGGDFDHSVDGIPYYETDAQKLTILGHGGNTDVTLAHGQIDFKGSGVVSSSAQVSELAGIENSTITIAAGDGLKTGGSFTLNADADSTITIDIDVDVMAGAGLVADNTNEELDVNVDDSSIEISSDALQVKASGITNTMLAGSIADSKLSTISTAGKVDLAALEIDGGTDIGEALVDADLMIVDNGAGGTNRKATMSRLATYMQSALTFSSGDIEGVTAGSGITGGGTSGTVVVSVDSGSLVGDGLTAKTNGSGLEVKVDDSTIEINSDTLRVKDNGVTLAKLPTQSNNTILGNISGGSAVPSALTAANVRTIINVEDGATADQTKSDIDGLAITTVGTLASGDATAVVSAASATAAGKVELATTAETTTGTDATRAVTPDGLKDGYQGSTNVTTLGTIATGTWNGTAIDKTYLDDEVYNTSLNAATGSYITAVRGVTAGGNTLASGETLAFTAGSNITITEDGGAVTIASTDTNTQLTTEQVQDIVGAMFTGNTETRIAATYEDGDGTIDLVVTDMTANDNDDVSNANLLTRLAALESSGGTSNENITIGTDSGDTIVITGNLQVNGTTTTVDSTTVNIGDNILELNYAGTAADAGILVADAVSTGTSGSLLWDASEDYWIAGALGSEGRVIVGNGTDTAGKITKFSADGIITDSILSESGTTLTIANNVIVSGLTASQLVVTNGSKQLVSSTDISSLTLTLDGGEF